MRNAATTGKRIGYGWLYNWYAVDHASGLAPYGWKIPTQSEAQAMGDRIIATYGNVTSSNLARALQSTYNVWSGVVNTFDIINFSALPAGYRLENGSFDMLRYATRIQTSDEYNQYMGTGLSLTWLSEDLGYVAYSKEIGCSIRCIQDKTIAESDGDTGTLTDIDGNIYKYIVIGDYRWMAENLRTTKYKNGNTIPEITTLSTWAADTTGARCAYNNDHYFVYPPLK